MNWHYFKIAWRNISKRKLQNTINLIGLICGVTFIMLVGAFIWDAYQVNTELRNKDQQFILQSTYKTEGIGIPLTTIGALPKALHEEYPQLVANYYRLDGLTCIISNGSDNFEEGVSLGDPTLLSMFGFDLYEGNPQTALEDPFSVVLTEKAALKYFGNTHVLGKNIKISNFRGDRHDFVITGVIKPQLQNSVLELTPAMQSDIFLPIASEKYFGRNIDSWENIYIAGFLELREGVKPDQLINPIKDLVNKNMDPEFSKNYGPQINPLSSYYLDDNNAAVKKMIKILIYISGFILLMAIINFINFSIGQNISRLKEIGVRKIMGAQSSQIAKQLLIEYIVLVFVVILFCLPVYMLVKPVFDNIFMRNLPNLNELPVYFYGALFILTLLIGILSGIYPALKLSKNGILNSVKLQLNRVNKKNEVRKVLLFIQFSVAIIILTSTLIISKQINLFINGDMGYKKDYLLTVQVPRDWSVEGVQKMQTIQKELSELNEIKNISLSYETPNNIVGRTTISSTSGNQNPIASQMITSDSQYGITYEIPMVAGKFFSNNIVDSNRLKEIVLNKQAVQSLGFKSADEIIGKNIFLDNDEPAIVTGVTENFIANSMHSANTPIIWTNVSHNTIFRYFNIRLEAGSIANSVDKLEKRWKELMPDSPFQYQFIDDSIRKMYETELKLQKASISATFISLLIVCLGISGLVSLAIKSRNKEVGMRKILGASLYDLLVLFSKEYYIIFICSIIFAVPISYLLMKIWLENYEFRVDLSLFTFLGPVILLTFLLSVLMFLILVRTTRFNPIEKLREE